ncbi:hypothetical protein H0H93_001624 [Arthromyces matolae]|nr:hypothetical protein H0H93_001624 [Arthromyces matolae]
MQAFTCPKLFSPSSLSNPERKTKINIALAELVIAQNWFQPVVNDDFIIWRAWVLFGRRRWALYLSITLATLNTISTVLLLAWYSHVFDADLNVLILRGATIPSLVSNVVATSYIGYTLWMHAKTINKSMGSRGRRPFGVKRILFLLVETGVVYAVLQLCTIVLNGSFVYPALTLALIHGPFLNESTELYESVIVIQNSAPGVDMRH